MRKIVQVLVVVIILSLGLATAFYLVHTKPRLKKRKPVRHVPLVETMAVQPADERVEIEEFGTVQPLRTGKIVPEVSGRIVYLSPNLVAGARFRRGEVLVRLDPVDYETAVALAEGELREAEKALAEIEAAAEAAVEEWYQVLKKKTPPPPLVAKEPQLAAARARVKAARAKWRKAKEDLRRTVIRAPFDGFVVKADVDLGQYVGPTTTLAEVYDASAVEVRVPLESREIRWIKVPGFNAQNGSGAEIFSPLTERPWRGRVVRAAAQADEKTRLIDVFVRVNDPFSRRPPLLPGTFVRVRIKGRLVKGVYVLPRDLLHLQKGRYEVYLVDGEGRLEIRPVEVLLFTKTRAFVRGLYPGARVITSRLPAPVPGMKVRIKES
ncbi:MAG: efflux RND transporter periplasmic adaptor subunit [Thermodesulfobacteria bacterium]|nr:efflux RND transporter periplasmic adaptor subunit [Thermodesulfobacteriota bacterium]